MAFTVIGSFEVLANPVAPGIPNVPFVQQGFFLQISNLGGASALVSVEYEGTPKFIASRDAIKLFTNIIDESGTPQQYPTADFLGLKPGFKALDLPAGATWLIGAQYILLPPPPVLLTAATGGTPQDSLEARGVVKLAGSAGSRLAVLATVRQVFSNFDATGALLDISEGAYAVPLIGGPLHHF